MKARSTTALTALALAAAVTASITACGGGTAGKSVAAAPKVTPVAAVLQDTTPLPTGQYRVALEGPVSGILDPGATVTCEHASYGGYDLTLSARLAGVQTDLDFDNVTYAGPGHVELRGSSITANVAQSDVFKDWRNQSIDSGSGGITYNPDGRSGSFDITLPEIEWETAAIMPGGSQLHVVGRWSCGAVTTS